MYIVYTTVSIYIYIYIIHAKIVELKHVKNFANTQVLKEKRRELLNFGIHFLSYFSSFFFKFIHFIWCIASFKTEPLQTFAMFYQLMNISGTKYMISFRCTKFYGILLGR